MTGRVQEFVAQRAAELAGRVRSAGVASIDSARGAARTSAKTIKHLQSPVRVVGRSGVKLSAVTQTLTRNLIELQTDLVSAALADTARRLERAASAASLVELIRDQIGLLPSTRTRVLEDAQRTASVLGAAGREVRGVAAETFREIVASGQTDSVPARAKRRAKSTRKRTRRARKTA
jgi:hypothetical protein